jgi:ribosomal protein L11 methyltransferase
VPVTIGDRVHVRPPWSDPPEDRTLLDLVIDPNQAFGTGAHATTRLCLEALLALDDHSGPLVDLGCGSGVLAIAAAKLGWAPVLGLDHEHEAVVAARANAKVNGVALDARHGDLLHDGVPAPGAPTVVANLLRPLLAHIARTGFAGERPRVRIVGGLLLAEADAIAAAFAREQGLREQSRRRRGDWVALTLVAADRAEDLRSTVGFAAE